MDEHSRNTDSNPVQKDDSRELSRASFGATAGILLSRFSGLFRTQVVNAVFGASAALDAFYVALRFPSALRDLFAEGALSSAFTKVYVEARQSGLEAERKLIATVTAFFGVVTLLIAFAGYFFARDFITLVTDEKFQIQGSPELAAMLFRMLVFYLPVAMISSVAMSVLGTLRMTFRATIASAFFNVGTIAGAVTGPLLFKFFGWDPVFGLAGGTLLGGVLQFGYQAVPLLKKGLFPLPKMSLKDITGYAPLHTMLLLMGPRTIAQGANIFALLINTHFATLVGLGALVYITNAQTLILVPVGLFGVAAGFSSLPILTEAVHSKNGEKFVRLLTESLHSTLWLALSTIIGFALLIVPFCIVVFEHGRFLRHDAIQTALAVNAYSIGVLFNSGSKVLANGLFALGNTRRAVVNSVVYLCVNATLSAVLAPRFGIVGLGLSNSIAATVDFSLNLYFLSKTTHSLGLVPQKNIFRTERHNYLAQFVIFGIIAFASGLGGMFVTEIWADKLLHQRGFLEALVALGLGGAILGTAVMVVTVKAGPLGLKTLCEGKLRRIFRR